MGYNTYWSGELDLSRRLTKEERDTINSFQEHDDGWDGKEYPDYRCNLITYEDKLTWDEGEKTYELGGWVSFFIEHYFVVWGVEVNGIMQWSGEDDDDKGRLHVYKNSVQTLQAEVVHPEPVWS